MTATRLDTLDQTYRMVQTRPDPDGPDAVGALMLAGNTALRVADADPARADHWTFAALAIMDARDRLVEDLLIDVAVYPDPAPADPLDADRFRTSMRLLVAALADLYNQAADHAAPWRALVWCAVAQDLDRAAAELE